jgi:glycosyltransferase involved in cell wall biosynthesis
VARSEDWSEWWQGRRILFLSGTGGGSRRYRCHHRAEQLALLGAEADVVPFREADLAAAVRGWDCFVLHRVAAKRKVEAFLEAARRRRKPVLYDSDDLVFDPAAADLMTRPGLDLERTRGKLAAQGRTLALCAGATVSTEPLAALARARNPRVALLPNVVTAAMVSAGETARREAPPRAGVTLGYFSGTPTHDRDFAEIAGPLVELLAARPEVRLLVAGPVELDPGFGPVRAQVERVERVPWEELPALLARAEVSLAPLERDNRFTECKSCVKFLEAGLVAVPTVASRVPDFERVVEDGENGLLASTPREWREALERVAGDAAARSRLGEAALRSVRSSAPVEASAVEAARTLGRLLAAARPGPVAARRAGARALGRAFRTRLGGA